MTATDAWNMPQKSLGMAGWFNREIIDGAAIAARACQ